MTDPGRFARTNQRAVDPHHEVIIRCSKSESPSAAADQEHRGRSSMHASPIQHQCLRPRAGMSCSMDVGYFDGSILQVNVGSGENLQNVSRKLSKNAPK
jgi:hypothetical protein